MAASVSSLVGMPPLLFKIECEQGQVTDLPEYRFLGDKFYRLVVVLREISKGNSSAQDAYAFSCELKQIMDDPVFRQLVKGESNPKILLEHFDEEVRQTWKDLRDRARELTPDALNTLRLAAERERTGPRLAVSLSPSPAPSGEVHDGRARKRAVSLSDDDEEPTSDNDESDDEPLSKRTRSANNTRTERVSAPVKSAQRRDVPRPTVSVSIPRRNTGASSTPGSSSQSGSTSSSKAPSSPKRYTSLPSAKIRSQMPRTKQYSLLKEFIDYVEQDIPCYACSKARDGAGQKCLRAVEPRRRCLWCSTGHDTCFILPKTLD